RAVRHDVPRDAERRLLRPVRLREPPLRKPLHRPHELVEPARAEARPHDAGGIAPAWRGARSSVRATRRPHRAQRCAAGRNLLYRRADSRLEACGLHPAASGARSRHGLSGALGAHGACTETQTRPSPTAIPYGAFPVLIFSTTL